MYPLASRAVSALMIFAVVFVCLLGVVLLYTDVGYTGNPAVDRVVDAIWGFYDWLYQVLRGD